MAAASEDRGRRLPQLGLIGEQANRTQARANSLDVSGGAVDENCTVDDQLARPSEHERRRRSDGRNEPAGPPADSRRIVQPPSAPVAAIPAVRPIRE